VPPIVQLLTSGLVITLMLNAFARAQEPNDLSRMIELLDSEKLSVLAEAKELRARNANQRQQAALFDYSYGLTLVKFGRWQEAIDVLEPFAAARPQVYRARLLTARCYIELEKYDHAILQYEKLFEKMPTATADLEDVAHSSGTLYGFLNFARPNDCPEPLRQKLNLLAQDKFSGELKAKFESACKVVETRVTNVTDEIERLNEKAGQDAENKKAEELAEAQELRADAEAKARELESKDKDKTETINQLTNNLQQLQNQGNQIIARETALANEIRSLARLQATLVQQRPTTPPDPSRPNSPPGGGELVIIDPVQYNRLGREIVRVESELAMSQGQAQAVMLNYNQLMARAKGLMDQKQYEEFATKNEVNQLKKLADSKEKRAERDTDRKAKKGAAASRGLLARLKNYNTYDPLDMASNKQFLVDVAQKFLTKK
jgi:Anaphase-promoting complex, cyclosome, subunit 3